MSEEQRAEKRHAHAVRETEFLRLKRSRLGVDDFDPLKVIGRGAFGEVRLVQGRFSKELQKLHVLHITLPYFSTLKAKGIATLVSFNVDFAILLCICRNRNVTPDTFTL